MQKAPKNSLSTKHWCGYMFGDWGGCMTFALMGGTFNIYCTNMLNVNPLVLVVLNLIWTTWDAINDPMMGALLDKAFARSRNKNGKFRPWLLRATPLLAVSAIALWTAPTFLEGIPMLVALFISKRKYLYHIERKVNHHFEATVNRHLEERVNRHLKMKVNTSFRKEN